MKTTEELIGMINALSDYEQSVIYFYLRAKNIKSDVEGQCETRKVELNENSIKTIVSKFIYGDYDPNLSYWENIDKLIDEYHKKEENNEVEEYVLMLDFSF